MCIRAGPGHRQRRRQQAVANRAPRQRFGGDLAESADGAAHGPGHWLCRRSPEVMFTSAAADRPTRSSGQGLARRRTVTGIVGRLEPVGSRRSRAGMVLAPPFGR
jgi:hypothetical protein